MVCVVFLSIYVCVYLHEPTLKYSCMHICNPNILYVYASAVTLNINHKKILGKYTPKCASQFIRENTDRHIIEINVTDEPTYILIRK